MSTPTASINVLSIRFSSCFSRIPRHNQKIATLIETHTYMSAVRTSKVLFNCTSSSYPSGSPVPPVFRRWSFPLLMLTDVHRRDRDASRRVARFIQFHSVQAPRISSLSFFAFLAFDQTLCVLTTPDTLSKHRILSVKLIVPNKWKKTFR